MLPVVFFPWLLYVTVCVTLVAVPMCPWIITCTQYYEECMGYRNTYSAWEWNEVHFPLPFCILRQQSLHKRVADFPHLPGHVGGAPVLFLGAAVSFLGVLMVTILSVTAEAAFSLLFQLMICCSSWQVAAGLYSLPELCKYHLRQGKPQLWCSDAWLAGCASKGKLGNRKLCPASGQSLERDSWLPAQRF